MHYVILGGERTRWGEQDRDTIDYGEACDSILFAQGCVLLNEFCVVVGRAQHLQKVAIDISHWASVAHEAPGVDLQRVSPSVVATEYC